MPRNRRSSRRRCRRASDRRCPGRYSACTPSVTSSCMRRPHWPASGIGVRRCRVRSSRETAAAAPRSRARREIAPTSRIHGSSSRLRSAMRQHHQRQILFRGVGWDRQVRRTARYLSRASYSKCAHRALLDVGQPRIGLVDDVRALGAVVDEVVNRRARRALDTRRHDALVVGGATVRLRPIRRRRSGAGRCDAFRRSVDPASARVHVVPEPL